MGRCVFYFAVVALITFPAAVVGQRQASAGHWFLTLDGVSTPVSEVSGSNLTSDVASAAGKTGDTKTPPAAKTATEFGASVAPGALTKSLADWISGAMSGQTIRKDGSIIATDFNDKAVMARDFFHAVITKVSFPALDAASKDAA